MTKIRVFQSKKAIDLPTFIDSRGLVCANSGGGKSYAIRKILEETNDKVMAIILDVEGEFKTLREKFDFMLIGPSGDVPLNMKAAPLLPRKLLDLGVSTIIDISDLKMHERVMYAKSFLEALMELPREYWKPCIIVLDEAHMLAGQQEKQESTHAVIDLCTRGRKRGFCPILCTQRVAKLHKDAVAELNNYMIGRTGLDIDMSRASEILGFTTKEAKLSLRDLEPGEFYVFGPALARGVKKERIGQVQTTHPKVGMDIRKEIIKPTDKIKAILTKISDLPKEAEAELKTKQDMEKKIVQLQREISLGKSKSATLDPEKLQVIKDQAHTQGLREGRRESEENTLRLDRAIKELTNRLNKVAQLAGAEFKIEMNYYKPDSYKPILMPKPIPIKKDIVMAKDISNPEEKLREGAMKMLNWLASVYPECLTKNRVATLSGFSVSGGTFNTYLSELKRKGWIEINGEQIQATEEGISYAQPTPMPSGDELLGLWCTRFREGASNILKYVYEQQSTTKSDIAEKTGFALEGGTFNTYLSELRRNALIKITGDQVEISQEFFQ